jgi:hypothetical protein
MNEPNHHRRDSAAVPMNNTMNSHQEVLLARVGGVLFALDQEAIRKFDSHVLTVLLDPHSPFEQPQDGIYKVDEADAESFSAFLHLARYQTIPCVFQHDTRRMILVEADFWGIQSKVEAAFSKNKKKCLVYCQTLGWEMPPDRRDRDGSSSTSLQQPEVKIQCVKCGRTDTTVCPYCQRSLKYMSDLACQGCQNGVFLKIMLIIVLCPIFFMIVYSLGNALDARALRRDALYKKSCVDAKGAWLWSLVA